MSPLGFTQVREMSGRKIISQCHLKSQEILISIQVCSTYGCDSLLKIVVKKDRENNQSTCTHRVYYATNMCYGIYSTRVCGIVGQSVISRSTQYIRF